MNGKKPYENYGWHANLMSPHFLFMDEKYADKAAPRQAQVTSLTGMMVPIEIHRVFREKYYEAVFEAVGKRDGIALQPPLIHASSLLPELGDDDERRIVFFSRVIQIVNDLNFRIYRIGYYPTRRMTETFGGERGIVGLCFSSILGCLEEALENSVVWPVMESDRSDKQDRSFAGHIQSLDSIVYQLGSQAASINNENLGEVLYSTKKSAYTSVVDCVAYLLHLAFLKSIGQEQTEFKSQLSEVAVGLWPAVAMNEVIDFSFEGPPPDYEPSGPIRYGRVLTRGS